MAVFGVICLAYFVLLRLLTKRWNSTFAWFWLAAGSIFLLFELGRVFFPGMFEWVSWEWFLVPALFFIYVECRIIFSMFPRNTEKCSCIIVLGAHVYGTKASEALVKRLETAYHYLEKYPEAKAVVCGGRGKGEDVTEASVMKDFLVAQGIARQRISMEEVSTTTKENFTEAARFIADKNIPIGVVTSNFHMYRSVWYANHLGYTKLYGIPAPCNALMQVNYIVREFLAVCKMWMFR